MRVVVVGGGIIGTTSALRLKARWPTLQVRVVAEKLSPDTTSDIAAGWWEPHLDPDTPAELVVRWSGETYNLLSSLSRGKVVEELGEKLSQQMTNAVRMMAELEVDSQPGFLQPPWSSLVAAYRQLSKTDLEKLGLWDEGLHSHSYLSYTLEPSVALPLMYTWLRERGVTVETRKLETLEELEAEADLVVNCCGLGAADLVNDKDMVPIAGHVLRVEAPWVGSVLIDSREDSWAYLIPNRDSLVLGSVDTRGRWDTCVREGDRELILARCNRLAPGVAEARLVREAVGLRPCRRGGVRLSQGSDIGSGLKVVHNYGHGGSGVTLSWGCAGQVVSIVEGILADMAANLS